MKNEMETIETCKYCGIVFDATEEDIIGGFVFCTEEHADMFFMMVGT